MGNVWDKTWTRKEGTFIWSIWHKAMAVNTWCVMFIKDIDDKCCMCNNDILKAIAHMFWDCRIVRRAWDFTIGIINTIRAKLGEKNAMENIELAIRKYPTYLANWPKFYFFLEASHYGSSGCK